MRAGFSLLLLGILTFLSGCASAGGATDSACLSFKPIHASSKDTAQTKREVIQHNARYTAVCK